MSNEARRVHEFLAKAEAAGSFHGQEMRPGLPLFQSLGAACPAEALAFAASAMKRGGRRPSDFLRLAAACAYLGAAGSLGLEPTLRVDEQIQDIEARAETMGTLMVNAGGSLATFDPFSFAKAGSALGIDHRAAAPALHHLLNCLARDWGSTSEGLDRDARGKLARGMFLEEHLPSRIASHERFYSAEHSQHSHAAMLDALRPWAERADLEAQTARAPASLAVKARL